MVLFVMVKSIRIGSDFLSVNQPKSQPWRRDIICGPADGTGRRLHLATSGAAVIADTWYLRDINENEIVKNGSELTNNTSQLLSDCIPNILRGFQHPERPLSWNVGSLDSFFSSRKKPLQL